MKNSSFFILIYSEKYLSLHKKERLRKKLINKFFGQLLNEIVSLKGITFDDNNMLDNQSNIIDWTDYQYIILPNTINNIDGVMIFGDGTIEFHELDEQAYNWADYENTIIIQILNELKSINKHLLT